MGDGNVENQPTAEEPQIRQSIDVEIVGDNIGQIALFTVEKYEFVNNVTLTSELREDAVRQIEDVLWQMVERLRKRQQEFWGHMFRLANETLEEALKSKD